MADASFRGFLKDLYIASWAAHANAVGGGDAPAEVALGSDAGVGVVEAATKTATQHLPELRESAAGVAMTFAAQEMLGMLSRDAGCEAELKGFVEQFRRLRLPPEIEAVPQKQGDACALAAAPRASRLPIFLHEKLACVTASASPTWTAKNKADLDEHRGRLDRCRDEFAAAQLSRLWRRTGAALEKMGSALELGQIGHRSKELLGSC